MDNKQVNRDWTIREERIPRKKDVVIDVDFNLGVVIKSEGDFGGRLIYVEDINGEEVYSRVPASEFKIANREQTVSFYEEYKKRTGWVKGKIYTVKGKDYPLILVDLAYDLMKQEMMYVFRDLNVPKIKYIKTFDNSLVEKIPEWYSDCIKNAFQEDSTSILCNEVIVSIKENDPGVDTWSVSGKSFNFSSKNHALIEIEKWMDRMKIRRIASVLSLAEKTSPVTVSVSDEDYLFITDLKFRSGQPAKFNSRIAAGVAIAALGDKVWFSALSNEIDTYNI